MAPATTVLMPAFRSHATVRESVESVLAQTRGDLEIVVVDDASEEPIAPVLADVRDPRLRVVRNERNRGPYASRNEALRMTRSPFVSQLDSDDVWAPEHLEAVLPELDDPAVGLVYANVSIRFHPEGRTVGIFRPEEHPIDGFPRICESCPIPSATATMRTAAVRAVGGYAEWLDHVSDYHLYLELARAGWRFAFVDRMLATYSWPEPHRGRSHDHDAVRRDELRMWLAFMARHPLTPGPRRRVRVGVPRELRRRLERYRRPAASKASRGSV